MLLFRQSDLQFLSTLSLRRATHGHCAFRHAVDISIHALLAESDVVTRSGSMRYLDFYPRSPCGERLRDQFDVAMSGAFLSTLSLRRATPRGGFCYLDNIISIHALLAESDETPQTSSQTRTISIHALLAESDGSTDEH